MNICNEIEEVKEGYQHPELIPGHLYKKDGGIYEREIYMYCKFSGFLVALNDGAEWNTDKKSPFGTGEFKWTDVTDQYCLKKVK